MGEESSRFSALWHGAMDRMTSKNGTFMPNVTKPSNGKETSQEDPDTSNLTPKQKRRAQVRKAQIEHRQRKQNFIKHLEQDVIDLREMIAKAEQESVLFENENEALKSTLARRNVPISLVPLAVPPTVHGEDNVFPSDSYQSGPQTDLSISPEGNTNWANQSLDSSSDTSVVSMIFDEYLDAMCLQISPSNNNYLEDTTARIAVPSSFDTNLSPFDSVQPAATLLHSQPSETIPLPTVATPTMDISTIAINFILALEHPCRTHFHPTDPSTSTTPFNPTGPPSGHELMASTLLYASTPAPVFSLPAFTTTTPPHLTPPAAFPNPPSTIPAAPPPPEPLSWSIPAAALQLQTLLEMSKSLPIADWEITPVQAWFRLVEVVGVEKLFGTGIGGGGGREGTGAGVGTGNGRGDVLKELKRRLGKLVGCWDFGAVVNERLFWDEVWAVLDVERTLTA